MILDPHELRRPRLWRLYNQAFLSQVDLLISLSDGATGLLRQRYPQLARVPVAVIPHGHYRRHYTAPADPDLFRRRMGLDRRPVLLCFGLLRPYKNIPGVIRAWRELPGPRPQLVVAGRPIDSALEAEVREAAEGAEDAHLLLDYAADQEVPSIFAAADVVVMPYTPGSALNSGAAHLALSMGRPVVVNDTPVNRDLQDFFGPEWVWLCGESPEAALRTAEAAAAAARPALPELSMLDPERLAALTRDAYAAAVRSRRGQPAGKARRGRQARPDAGRARPARRQLTPRWVGLRAGRAQSDGGGQRVRPAGPGVLRGERPGAVSQEGIPAHLRRLAGCHRRRRRTAATNCAGSLVSAMSCSTCAASEPARLSRSHCEPGRSVLTTGRPALKYSSVFMGNDARLNALSE